MQTDSLAEDVPQASALQVNHQHEPPQGLENMAEETDVALILEVLAQEIQREYKRFYGD